MAECGDNDVLLSVENLSVRFDTRAGTVHAVEAVTWKLRKGQRMALVGESGCGKSASALAIMGLLADNATTRGSIHFEGRDLLTLNEKQRRALRGGQIAMIFQDPLSALNPVLTVERQIVEAIRVHQKVPLAQARTRATDLLGEVGIPQPRRRARDYPHQFSGGMRQRVMIAMALANDPQLLIADEPTTALDVTVQAQVLDVIDRLQAQRGTALLLISHDLGVVAGHSDQVAVMYAGRMAERGTVERILATPQHPYTQGLIGSLPQSVRAGTKRLHAIKGQPPSLLGSHPGCAFHPRCSRADEECRVSVPEPRLMHNEIVNQYHVWCHHPGEEKSSPCVTFPDRAPPPAGEASELLRVQGLSKEFRVRAGWRRQRLVAVNDVSFSLRSNSTFALVGESGSGKTTLARCVLGLLPPSAGSVVFRGRDITRLSARQLRGERRHMQMVFQDPLGSLDPLMSVRELLEEPFHVHGVEPEDTTVMLERVGLRAEHAARRPTQLSGGQLQRVGVARALALRPSLVVCDEPVSALDVSVRAQIINLLEDLKEAENVAYLLVAHDISLVRHVSDDVGVMYRGRVVESGPTTEVLSDPAHPYTSVLLSAVPLPDPSAQHDRRLLLPVAEDNESRTGCPFASRCPYRAELDVTKQTRCDQENPTAQPLGRSRTVACHYPAP